jgi:AcrR family transcriptional regulator
VPRKPTPEVENRIIQAATEIILSNGIVGLRVRDVAQASGTTVAMVYRRFIDRDGLLDAAVANFYDARIESLIDIAEDLARRPTPIQGRAVTYGSGTGTGIRK